MTLIARRTKQASSERAAKQCHLRKHQGTTDDKKQSVATTPGVRSKVNRETIAHGKAAAPGAVHPHEVAVHFDRITPSWEVEGALTLVEFDQHLALHVVDVGTINHLGGTADAPKISDLCRRKQRTSHFL